MTPALRTQVTAVTGHASPQAPGAKPPTRLSPRATSRTRMDSTLATSSAQWATMNGEVKLRALREADLAFLDRLSVDPDAAGVFMWSGYRDVRSRRKRWESDGYISADSVLLAITLAGAEGKEPIGMAGWQTNPRHQPGACYEIGLTVLPEHRGRGLGTAAHQQLVRHLFRFTTAHRPEALTDAENLPEQRALERAGFALEGRRRQVFFQFGTWRDELMYGLLRSEASVSQRSRFSVRAAGRSDHAPAKRCLRRLRDLRGLNLPDRARLTHLRTATTRQRSRRRAHPRRALRRHQTLPG